MSDYEEEDDEQQRGLENILKRYKQKGAGSPTAASADKRHETSKTNMAKARAAKIAKLKAQKQEQIKTIEVSEDDDDDGYSDSDGEYIPTPKKQPPMKGKGRPRQTSGAVDDGRLARLEQMEMRLAAMAAHMEKENRQRRMPPKQSKTAVNIQIAPPAAPTRPSNPRSEQLRQSVLNF